VALVPCRKCGAKISERALACPKCGSKEPHKALAVICSECGAELSIHHQGSCPGCGNPDILQDQPDMQPASLVDQAENPESTLKAVLARPSQPDHPRPLSSNNAKKETIGSGNTPETSLARNLPQSAQVRQRPREQYRNTPLPTQQLAYSAQSRSGNLVLLVFAVICIMAGLLILYRAVSFGYFAGALNGFLQLFCGLFVVKGSVRRRLIDSADILMGSFLAFIGIVYGLVLMYDGFRPRLILSWEGDGFLLMGWFGTLLVISSAVIGALVKRLPKARDVAAQPRPQAGA
jgi:ribosomal protein L40E